MNTDLYAYIWRTFPDAQTRRASGQYFATDVGRIAFQIDDVTFWRLDSVINPGINAIPTWTQINGDELPGLTIRGAGNPIDNVTTITFPDATIVNLGNGEVQVLTGSGGGGAPVNAEYITASDDPTLTNERVLTNTPTVVWDTTVPGQVRAEVPDGGIVTPKLADKSVEYSKIQDVTPNRILGRGATSGPVQEIQIGTGLSLSGTTLSATGGGGGAPEDAEYLVGAANSGLTNERVVMDTSTVAWDLSVSGQARAEVPDDGITTSKIAPEAVTYSRIQNVTNGRLLGRSSFLPGSVQEIQVGTGLLLSGGVLESTVSPGNGGCVFGVDDSLLGEFMVRDNPGWNNQTNGSNITTVSFVGSKLVLTIQEVSGGSNHYSAYYWDSPASGNFTIQGVLNAIGRIGGSASRFFGMYVGNSGNALVVGIEESSSQLQRLRVSLYSVGGDAWGEIGGSDYSIVWTPNFAIRIELTGTQLNAYMLNYPGYLCRFYSTTNSFFTSINRVGLFVQRDSNWTTHFFCHDFRVV